MIRYRIHPVLDVLPTMPDNELQPLADDMKKNGQREPIVRCDGEILDGRNRLRACALAGIEPLIQDITPVGGSLAFIIGANLRRLHMSVSQRALAAATLASLKLARSRRDGGGVSQGRAATLFGVSRSLVQAATMILKCGEIALIEDVRCGRITVSRAKQVLRAKEFSAREKATHSNTSGADPAKWVSFSCREGVADYALFEGDGVTEATPETLARGAHIEIPFANGSSEALAVYVDVNGKIRVKIAWQRKSNRSQKPTLGTTAC